MFRHLLTYLGIGLASLALASAGQAFEHSPYQNSEFCDRAVAFGHLPPPLALGPAGTKAPSLTGVRDAAVVILRNSRGEVLFGQRASGSHSGAGTWGMPGGKCDPEDGEDPRVGAARELKEELGLAVKDLRWLHTTYNLDQLHGEPRIFRVFVFEGQLDAGDLTPLETSPRDFIIEPHKMSDLGWFSAERLPAPLFAPTLNYWSAVVPKLFPKEP